MLVLTQEPSLKVCSLYPMLRGQKHLPRTGSFYHPRRGSRAVVARPAVQASPLGWWATAPAWHTLEDLPSLHSDIRDPILALSTSATHAFWCLHFFQPHQTYFLAPKAFSIALGILKGLLPTYSFRQHGCQSQKDLGCIHPWMPRVRRPVGIISESLQRWKEGAPELATPSSVLCQHHHPGLCLSPGGEPVALCIPGPVSAMALRLLPPVSLQCCSWPSRSQHQSSLTQPLSTALSAGSSFWALLWPISLSLSLRQAAGKPPGFGSLPGVEGSPASAGPAHSKENDCLLDQVPRVPLLHLHHSFFPAAVRSGLSDSADSMPPETLLHQSPWPPSGPLIR